MKRLLIIAIISSFIGCNNSGKKNTEATTQSKSKFINRDYQAISLSGDTLRSPAPSEELISRFTSKKEAFDLDTSNIQNIIWYGRFTAYLGNYKEAIEIYSEALKKYPNEPRLYRHRGHRYITIREFDKAIIDFTRAAALIKGKENQVEEDGMPNAQNIPVSTLHGNIYYHLGLAYYLIDEQEAALKAFKKCLESSHNPDNVVSATHWIYMIFNRLGREAAGENYLRNVKPGMNVIENTAYYQACLFYKGDLKKEDIYPGSAAANSSNSALNYSFANWLYYNGYKENAGEVLKEIIAGEDWNSFGFIAAESDLARLYK
jgi:tetratricopeptide (TPR) repeat protein|tara:strand:+ start:7765 stop:8718 length:954 start_codon:yes stop_codon:yes gene_type:complete